jgi:heme/copper-type cytochrome/quinol oxidase subunit 4
MLNEQQCQEKFVGHICVRLKNDEKAMMAYRPSNICSIGNKELFKKNNETSQDVKEAYLWYTIVKWIFIVILGLTAAFMLWITFMIGWSSIVPLLFMFAILSIVFVLIFGLLLLSLKKSGDQNMIAKCESKIGTYGMIYSDSKPYDYRFDINKGYSPMGSPTSKDLISVIKSGILPETAKINVSHVDSIIKEYDKRLEEAKRWSFISGIGTRAGMNAGSGALNMIGNFASKNMK